MAPDRRGLARVASSIRFRITAIATVVVAAVLVAAGVGLAIVQHRLLVRNLEDAIRRRADVVTSGPLADPLPGDGDDSFAQVVDPAGVVLAASANLAGADPVAPLPVGEEAWRRVVVPVDDETFLVLSRRLDQPAGAVLHTGESLDDVSDATRILAGTLAGVIPVIVTALAVVMWWLVGRTLRPVETIRAEVDRITGSDMARRVPEPVGDDEIARLARTMNAMLDRLGDAAGRQQRFVADASHELRGPLARIRTELEVDLAHPDPDAQATERRVLGETVAMQHLVDDLLDLARSDAGAELSRPQAVDLDDLVVREVAVLGPGLGPRIDLREVSAAQVMGDAAQLARAIRNLLDNARRHAATTVTVALAEVGDVAVLRITDDGPGIPADQQARVFERFARLDEARSSSTGGTGLGLAIARDVIERHRGTVEIDPQHQPGTAAVVTLPTTHAVRS